MIQRKYFQGAHRALSSDQYYSSSLSVIKGKKLLLPVNSKKKKTMKKGYSEGENIPSFMHERTGSQLSISLGGDGKLIDGWLVPQKYCPGTGGKKGNQML